MYVNNDKSYRKVIGKYLMKYTCTNYSYHALMQKITLMSITEAMEVLQTCTVHVLYVFKPI